MKRKSKSVTDVSRLYKKFCTKTIFVRVDYDFLLFDKDKQDIKLNTSFITSSEFWIELCRNKKKNKSTTMHSYY